MENLSDGCTNVLRELRGLAIRLEERYAGVRVIAAYVHETIDGDPQQTIKYLGSLALLKQYGLVTDWMLSHMRDEYGLTELGDGFLLKIHPETGTSQTCCELSFFTGTYPREWRRSISTVKLQRIASRALRAISARRP